jgi:glutathione synthase/RimK-type ligase-like ATP-grasp enzyme
VVSGVLIVGPPSDDHAPIVAAEIARQGGRAEIVDLAAFPERVSLTMRYDCCSARQFVLAVDGRSLDLTGFVSVWWRRPQAPQVSAAIVRPSHRSFAANEADQALSGLWHALDAFWINDPKRDEVAHRKPFQLRVAQDVGLQIPDTLMTNDPDEARLFIDRHGYRNVVFKSFSATQTEWRETRLLGREELHALDNVRHAPVIFQEYVEAAHDLRVTVVGRQVFAAAIHSQETAYPVDFRMDMGHARVEAVALPEPVEGRLFALMDRLGLVYGAIDMRRTPDDRHVFLEINPAGQFLFIEQLTGQPIAATLAAALLRGASS